VNDTPAKRRYGAPVGVAPLTEAARLGLPLVAIGGVTVDDVAALHQAGAHGVACIRALIAAPDPEQSARTFCQLLK